MKKKNVFNLDCKVSFSKLEQILNRWTQILWFKDFLFFFLGIHSWSESSWTVQIINTWPLTPPPPLPFFLFCSCYIILFYMYFIFTNTSSLCNDLYPNCKLFSCQITCQAGSPQKYLQMTSTMHDISYSKWTISFLFPCYLYYEFHFLSTWDDNIRLYFLLM